MKVMMIMTAPILYFSRLKELEDGGKCRAKSSSFSENEDFEIHKDRLQSLQLLARCSQELSLLKAIPLLSRTVF